MTGARLQGVAPAGALDISSAPGRRLSPAQRIVVGVLPVVGAIAVWWVFALIKDRARVFPTPDLIFSQLLTILEGTGETGSAYDHIFATMARLIAAFLLSFVLGVGMGILAGRVKIVFSLIENLVWVFMAVPSVIWVFIFVVALGLTDAVPVLAISALLTPMILVNVAEGAKAIPYDLIEMSLSYKTTTRQRVLDVYLPALMPYLVSSARTAFALGIKLVIVAEVVGLDSGIGFEIKYWYGRLFMGPIIAWSIVMIVIGLVVDYGIFGPIERRVGRWKGRPTAEAAL